MSSDLNQPPTLTELPRGARTALRAAKRAHAGMRRFSVRGNIKPGAEYLEHRKRFLDALRLLSFLGVKQQVVADELGVTRSAVSQWLSQAS